MCMTRCNPTFFPPLWAGAATRRSERNAEPVLYAAIKLTQTYSPNLLNETAFLYSGNKILPDPIPVWWRQHQDPEQVERTSFFPIADSVGMT